MDSVNYQIQRQDRSVYDDNGEPVLQFYYDLVVLEGSSDTITQINDTLAQECQTFLQTNQQSVDDTIAQFNPAPLPELMDRKKRDIMERKGDKEDENKRQKQQKESSAAAL